MKMTLFAAVVISMLSSSIYCYMSYQHEIPNGDNVPNPCDRSTKWMGVGHQNPMGGGARNPFGKDFADNGHTWTKTLCQKDSDGDGLSNGQELGDPNCTWTAGQSPARTWNLTQPGICEPLGSTMCADKNTFLRNCSNMKFDCPAINDPGVKNYTMKFPQTSVPAEETTYICYLFPLPNTSDADIIAIEPVIDNLEILHHMLLFGCNDIADIPSNQAYKCGMSGGLQCTSLIGLWGFGTVGQCLNSHLGFRIGPTGFKYAVVQLHWNNLMLKANLKDSSGMRIYYTDNLRPNRGEIMMVGQEYLVIPPGKDNVSFSGGCSALCTKEKMNQSVYITSSILHMHLLGKSGIIRLYRNGQLLSVIEEVTNYDYNNPTMMEFKTPIEMKPGDSIQVECVYNSTGQNNITTWGESTSNEMCYGFFAYYTQIPDFTFCGQWKSIAHCGWSTKKSDLCDLTTFMNYAGQLPRLCSANCSDSQCVETLNAALKTGCQRDEDVRAYYAYWSDVWDVLDYCALARRPASSHCSLARSYSGSIPMLAFVVYIRRPF